MDPKNLKDWFSKRRARINELTAENLFHKLQRGDKNALSSAITLIESTSSQHKQEAQLLVKKCLPFSGISFRIGITGVPGVGKSTFIEAFGTLLIRLGKRVAVLAVDPSSLNSGGSILGDKTRMPNLSVNPNAFVRPSAAGATLGGVAATTRESIFLCEAAGFDVVLIETVGVGQSETLVHSMVDFFLLLMLSGAGDELQGMKRGIMEMADLLVITKADGNNIPQAELAAKTYNNALHLFPEKESKWIAKATICSAIEQKNLDFVWEVMERFYRQAISSGWLTYQRKEQDKQWLTEMIKELLIKDFFQNSNWKIKLSEMEDKIAGGEATSLQGALQLFNEFKSNE
jgi:LAO/AO transport system kinase